jgi:DNA modification methylase
VETAVTITTTEDFAITGDYQENKKLSSITWKTVTRKVGDLSEWDQNPRVITELAFNQLVESIQQDGYHHRIMITQDNLIIGGHQRKRALLAVGLSEDTEIEVIQAQEPLTAEQFARLNIRDNIGYGQFDFDKLANMYTPIQLIEWHMPQEMLPTMSEQDEALAGGKKGLTDDDEVPDEPVEPTAKLGDLYKLGNHFLLCGDSTNIADVEKLMNGQRADMVYTDPPYGVGYVGQKDNVREGIKNDSLKTEDFEDFLFKVFTSLFLMLKEGAAYYVSSPQGGNQMMMMMMMMKAGMPCRHELIWVKNSLVMGRCDYHYKHEPILYGWKEGAAHSWYGDRDKVSVWEVSRPSASKLHPTMKPVELIEIPLKNSSKEGDAILDLFGGSGSTLIACEKLNRKCFMCELEPRYVDVIIKRYEDYTGNKATLVKEN